MSQQTLSRAIRPVIESLEGRRLLHGGHLHLDVNFQPAGAVVPAGYVADSGLSFADRGNGFSYGWDAANTAGARERNKLADQPLDTINHTQAYGARTWEVAVPNGQYTVKLVAGDADYFNSVYKFNVEGVLTVNGTPTTGARFVEGAQTVTVVDGRLTISNAAGANNNKLAYVQIAQLEAPQGTVRVQSRDTTAREEGQETAEVEFVRDGNVTQPLVVRYALSGTATNGVDYQQLFGTVTIAPGDAVATVTLNPIDDSVTESANPETVIFTILADDAYSVGQPSSLQLGIVDNDAVGSGFSTKINFQPANVPVPAGYNVDAGLAYGSRVNGLTYGWVGGANTVGLRDRNAANSPDQRYDTINHVNNKTWELALPNGQYNVRVVAGDAGYFDSVYKIQGEGQTLIVNGTPSSGSRWVEGNAMVWVSDGKLTINNAAGAFNTKVCFIEITDASLGGPIVNVTAGTAPATESGATTPYTFTRTGDGTKPLTIYYTISGSATNGADYQSIASSVTFPAGEGVVTVRVTPIDDAIAEGTETATVTLVSHASYTLGIDKAATINIADNDTPVGNTITWTGKLANPLARAEALRAVVDGKLYVFGGFGGNGPVNRHDVYDPATNTWSPRTASPTRLTHAGVAVDGRDIYVAGGYIGTSTTGTGWAQKFGVKDVWKYNVDTNQWTAFTALPKEVAGGGLVLLGRNLHWVSGNNNARQDIGDHYVLNLDNPSATWQTAVALPLGRSHLGVVTVGGKIYAIGGQFGNDDLLTTQKYVHVWDPASPSAWQRLADMPTAISHIASATFVMGNRVITAGGETGHTAATDLVYAYDVTTNSWVAMTKLPAKRFSGVAAEIGGDIYFTTGSSQTTTWKGVIS